MNADRRITEVYDRATRVDETEQQQPDERPAEPTARDLAGMEDADVRAYANDYWGAVFAGHADQRAADASPFLASMGNTEPDTD